MTLTPILLLCVAAAPPEDWSAEDWPQLHGPGGDRRTPDTVDPADLVEPRVAWRVPTPGGFSSFAVADTRALTLIEREGRECCVALDAASGEELWARPLGSAEYDGGGDAGAEGNEGGDGPRVTPVIDGERVYVYDAHLVLWCLAAEDGEVVWKRDVQEEYDGRPIQWQNASAPVLEAGRVLVAGGGEGRSLLAFDAETGEMAWSTGDDTLTHATPTAATLHGVRQVIFYLRGGLTSVDPESGEVLWSVDYPFRVSSAASPVVWEDLVYVSAGYGVGAALWRIEREEGAFQPEFLWRKRNDLMNHWSTPVARDGHLYGMFSFKEYGEGPLQCVELETGEVRWSAEGFGPGNAILAGDRLVALSDVGEVVLVEATPEAYRELARTDVLEGKCWSSPALAGEELYVRSTAEGVRLDLGSDPR